jgi:hypothetical protein
VSLMYRRPHVICVAALVCQSGPALAMREPGSACGIRGQKQFPPLQALWNGRVDGGGTPSIPQAARTELRNIILLT